MNDVIKTIKSRRSVRAYTGELLKKEELDAIVEAGIYAPTGHNMQAWHFAVVQDRALIEELCETTKKKMSAIPVDWISAIGRSAADITHGAPALVIVSSAKGTVTGEADCTAALENMLLAAESLDIGSCWMGFVALVFDDADMMRKLGVPEGNEPQQAAVFGRKAKQNAEAPERKRDVVTYTGTF